MTCEILFLCTTLIHISLDLIQQTISLYLNVLAKHNSPFQFNSIQLNLTQLNSTQLKEMERKNFKLFYFITHAWTAKIDFFFLYFQFLLHSTLTHTQTMPHQPACTLITASHQILISASIILYIFCVSGSFPFFSHLERKQAIVVIRAKRFK